MDSEFRIANPDSAKTRKEKTELVYESNRIESNRIHVVANLARHATTLNGTSTHNEVNCAKARRDIHSHSNRVGLHPDASGDDVTRLRRVR